MEQQALFLVEEFLTKFREVRGTIETLDAEKVFAMEKEPGSLDRLLRTGKPFTGLFGKIYSAQEEKTGAQVRQGGSALRNA